MFGVDLSSIISIAPFVGLILVLSGIGILFKTYSDSITLASILIIILGVLVIGSSNLYNEYRLVFAAINFILGAYIAYKGRNLLVVLLGIGVVLLSFSMVIF